MCSFLDFSQKYSRDFSWNRFMHLSCDFYEGSPGIFIGALRSLRNFTTFFLSVFLLVFFQKFIPTFLFEILPEFKILAESIGSFFLFLEFLPEFLLWFLPVSSGISFREFPVIYSGTPLGISFKISLIGLVGPSIRASPSIPSSLRYFTRTSFQFFSWNSFQNFCRISHSRSNL